MKVVSTFAGCGGSSTGYKMAGAEVVAAVEWDDHAVACYTANHPTTKMFHGDIAKVKGADILKAAGLEVGELDLLDGSPPCQGFSTAGARVLDDPRNQLFRQHLRLVDEMQPKSVVIENVAGMLKGKMRKVAAEIFRALEARGYNVAAGEMQSCYFGVGQFRPRVFFIGSKIGTPSLPRPTSSALTAGRALRGVDPGWIPPLRTSRHKFWASRMLPGEKGSECLKRINAPTNQSSYFNRIMLDPSASSPTIVKTPWDQYHWRRRFISINECKALMGFPQSYELPSPAGTGPAAEYSKGWARLGNAVAPPMSREIARQVLMPMSS